jgi:hypothetical protein
MFSFIIYLNYGQINLLIIIKKMIGMCVARATELTSLASFERRMLWRPKRSNFLFFFSHLLEIALSQPKLTIVLPFSFSCNCSSSFFY